MSSTFSPYLSVVAVSRNDDHGGDPLRRTQLFIDSLAWQAEHFSLETELIIVDWNPPEGKPGLAEVLNFPVNPCFCARVIVVPPELHNGYRHGDRLPLFQMIGKNVGIRRAKGQFIVATNIDILFDDALVAFLAKRELSPQVMYRVDRFDIDNALPSENHQEQQAFCRNRNNLIRTNQRMFPPGFHKAQQTDLYHSSDVLNQGFRSSVKWADITEDEGAACVHVHASTPYTHLATNACGDFTLMHKEAWERLRGYGEFEAYSMHIDSLGCIAAHLAGITECSLLPPLVCYHIEHAPGSGWTPESGLQLFERITKAGIPLIDWEIVRKTLLSVMEDDPSLLVNMEHWGLVDFSLPETYFDQASAPVCIPGKMPDTISCSPISAIKSQYDPGVFFQTVYYRQEKDSEYEYFQRLTNSPMWKVVHLGILCCRGVKKIARLVSLRSFMRK